MSTVFFIREGTPIAPAGSALTMAAFNRTTGMEVDFQIPRTDPTSNEGLWFNLPALGSSGAQDQILWYYRTPNTVTTRNETGVKLPVGMTHDGYWITVDTAAAKATVGTMISETVFGPALFTMAHPRFAAVTTINAQVYDAPATVTGKNAVLPLPVAASAVVGADGKMPMTKEKKIKIAIGVTVAVVALAAIAYYVMVIRKKKATPKYI